MSTMKLVARVPGRVLGMTTFQGAVVVATSEGVFTLRDDNSLVPVPAYVSDNSGCPHCAARRAAKAAAQKKWRGRKKARK